MKLILAGVALLCLLSNVSPYRPPKITLSVRNPKTVTVTEHVFFDLKVYNYYKEGEHLEGTFVVAVFGELLPMTGLNFISLARGYQKGGVRLSYNNTIVHTIIPDFIIQMGDIQHKHGQGGTSIFGPTFDDELFAISHGSAGIVSMANTGKDTNGSQFFITLQPARFLDGHHVAFGKVIAGMDLIKKIGNIASYKDQSPMKKVLVTAVGSDGLQSKYDMTSSQLEMDSEDINLDDFIDRKYKDDDEE